MEMEGKKNFSDEMCGGSACRPVPSPSVFYVSSFPSRILLSSVNDDDDQETVDGGNQNSTPLAERMRPVRKTQVRSPDGHARRTREDRGTWRAGIRLRHARKTKVLHLAGPRAGISFVDDLLPINGNVGLVPRRVDWT